MMHFLHAYFLPSMMGMAETGAGARRWQGKQSEEAAGRTATESRHVKRVDGGGGGMLALRVRGDKSSRGSCSNGEVRRRRVYGCAVGRQELLGLSRRSSQTAVSVAA